LRGRDHTAEGATGTVSDIDHALAAQERALLEIGERRQLEGERVRFMKNAANGDSRQALRSTMRPEVVMRFHMRRIGQNPGIEHPAARGRIC
jgi:hypothetical protein